MSRKNKKNICPPGFSARGHEADNTSPWPEAATGLPPFAAEWLAEMVITPHSASEWILEPAFWKAPRITTDINWMVFPDAEGEILIGPEETPYTVHPGDSIFLRPGMRHIEHFPMKKRWTMLSMHFSASVYGGVDVLGLLNFPLHLPATDENYYTNQARACIREYATQALGWEASLRALFTGVLLHTLRYHGNAFQTPPSLGRTDPLARLMPALALVEEQLGDPDLEVGDLADALQLSEVRLRTLFRDHLQATPVSYIQQRRISQACSLLRNPQRAIKDIAYACGFRDLAFFYRIFRKWMHTTPAKWRDEQGT